MENNYNNKKSIKKFSTGSNSSNKSTKSKTTQKSLKIWEDINLIIPETEKLSGIYLGNLVSAKDLPLLKSLKIESVLSLCNNSSKIEYNENEISHKRINAEDLPDFDISRHFGVCNKFINEERIKKRNILIHCNGGVSRGATILIAYIMNFEKKNLKESFDIVKEMRDQISPNKGFIKQLKMYEEELVNEMRRGSLTNKYKNSFKN